MLRFADRRDSIWEGLGQSAICDGNLRHGTFPIYPFLLSVPSARPDAPRVDCPPRVSPPLR